MKKIILSAFLATALFSCKKQVENNEEKKSVEDSVTSSKTENAKTPLKALSIQEMNNYLQKKNDTLYVTNFFATWCGPCVHEIPFFKNKIQELKGKPVKITFVSLDSKSEWNTKVPQFTDEMGIRNNTVLLDGELIDQKFFSDNFKEWTGSAIPFTFMRKGDKTDETLGMMSEQDLNEKIEKLLNSKSEKK
ncbi:TlpA disulfide reductase family protein [Chryseobacterium sp. RR2-3-20]|uniref:TlpA family protein disulfide reductase n=1 Tax=Chryseobacterium sp. RR2-3-20 TaxID=2787626 RepID=UPI001AE05AED|nr:TlpA disulfide reductase family protein [Chryseobacterium sp. RR2-3-20]